MNELTKSQKGRLAIRAFKTIAEALALRGYYKPSGQSGQTLAAALEALSPEIYGSMNDPRIIELRGLEYVIDRLPRGIESCTRIVLTAQEELAETSFETIVPLKRRRTSVRVSDQEICFVITRGLTEIYDIMTHLTFLNNEAAKIRAQMFDNSGNLSREWKQIEAHISNDQPLNEAQLDQAIWNLSILLGTTFQETRSAYLNLESSKQKHNSNSGLFHIIHNLGKRMEQETHSRDDMLLIYFTPALRDVIGQHQYANVWADAIKRKLYDLGLHQRPLHIISANMHSVLNTLYGHGALRSANEPQPTTEDFYHFVGHLRQKSDIVIQYAGQNGFYPLPDISGAFIDCQIIDTAHLAGVSFHPAVNVEMADTAAAKPVILVMDYAFGQQAFEVMDELLSPVLIDNQEIMLPIHSVSVMGKAGILPGKKGDIMLATAHVIEGTTDNYIVNNELTQADFDSSVDVYTGPILTVLGTSLQNRDVLERFQTTSWKAVGLEMEGGHYQRAISAAIVRGHIQPDIAVRYAYYASDNPLLSGQTLASGAMGEEGVKPTYMITRIILEKILSREMRDSDG